MIKYKCSYTKKDRIKRKILILSYFIRDEINVQGAVKHFLQMKISLYGRDKQIQ